MRKYIFLIFISVLWYNCYSYQQSLIKNTGTSTINILFIGNSLTYYNDLPKLVKKYANKKGIKVKTEMIAYPNYAIMDHWNDGKAQKLISSNNYDYVIIQQGPSSQREGRKVLIEYGKRFNSLCKKNNSKLCYYMVWPSMNYYYTFDDVIKNHTDAASINNAILLPVGEIWKTHFDKTNNFDYYNSDGFHPSLKGSKKAAEIIVESLLNNNL